MGIKRIPEPKSRWLHKNGTIYTVHLVTNLNTTQPEEYPPTVVYTSDGVNWWSRPLSRWHGSMTLLPEQANSSEGSALAPEPDHGKYHVLPNRCQCHPETCCCKDWAVHAPSGDRCSTHFFYEEADSMAKLLNSKHTGAQSPTQTTNI